MPSPTHRPRRWLRLALIASGTHITETHVDARRPVTVGPAPGNTLDAPDLAGLGPCHRLFSPTAAGVALHPTAAMTGHLHRVGEPAQDLAELRLSGAAIPLRHGDWGRIELGGGVAIVFHLTRRPPGPPRRPLWAMLDTALLATLLAALALHLAPLLAAFAFGAPPVPRTEPSIPLCPVTLDDDPVIIDLDPAPPGGPASKGEPPAKRPRVRLAELDLSDACVSDDVRRVLRVRGRGLEYCYLKALHRRPALRGGLTLSWTVRSSGETHTVRADGTIGDADLADCARRVVRRWRFPAPDGEPCAVRAAWALTP